MLLEYRYYESYRPGSWTTPDRLRMLGDTGVDSDSAKMKLEFDGDIYPLCCGYLFSSVDHVPFHDYATVFNLPLDTTDFTAWEDM